MAAAPLGRLQRGGSSALPSQSGGELHFAHCSNPCTPVIGLHDAWANWGSQEGFAGTSKGDARALWLARGNAALQTGGAALAIFGVGKGLSALGEAAAAEEGAAAVGCFVAGTPVQMADGTSRPIEKVKAGDLVLARRAGDESAGRSQTLLGRAPDPVEAKRVLSVSRRTAPSVLRLTLADARTGQAVETLTLTREHPVFVPGTGFVPAGTLSVGAAIAARAGPALVVQSVARLRRAGGYTVYNFTVEGDHSYFVGKAHGGTWVHNGCGGVYKLLDEEGNVMRTGRTNDLARREVEHQAIYPDLVFQPIAETDDYTTQRGLEQMAHDQYSPPLNRIRPINPANPRYQEYMNAAQQYINTQGLQW